MTENLEVLPVPRQPRPPWYWLSMVALVPIIVSIGMLGVSLHLNQQSIERERAARLASESARLASERALCEVFVVLDDAYARVPPTTPAGVELARAVANVRAANHCPARVLSKPK